MKKRGFYPTEIIFAATNACNLHCKHCFIERNPRKLDILQAKTFLENCLNSARKKSASDKKTPLPEIERIGFSGGEPFLYMDFLIELTKTAVKHDLLFDQIMTNGDWWKTEEDLRQTLQNLYDAGYDGKIGLSWDIYHGQSQERMLLFIRTVQEIFGENSINIQTVDEDNENIAKGGESLPLSSATAFAASSATPSPKGASPLKIPPEILVYHLKRSYPSNDKRAWNSRRWFKEDYCEGPGHILYVHADGNIAPCCGFANENPELFIGQITDNLETIMENASNNKMVELCYITGLSHAKRNVKKQLKAQKKKNPGKCGDICSFCDFVCKLSH